MGLLIDQLHPIHVASQMLQHFELTVAHIHIADIVIDFLTGIVVRFLQDPVPACFKQGFQFQKQTFVMTGDLMAQAARHVTEDLLHLFLDPPNIILQLSLQAGNVDVDQEAHSGADDHLHEFIDQPVWRHGSDRQQVGHQHRAGHDGLIKAQFHRDRNKKHKID